MKSKILFLFLSISLFAKAQIINIPDNNLKTILTIANATTYQYAKNSSGQWIKIDANGNGEIEQSEALAVTWLNINTPYYATIPVTNLTGIEHFTNLLHFECRNNPIQTINFALPHLLELNAWNCNLSSVNFSGLTTLEAFDFSDNTNLTNIDLTGLPNLKSVWCPNDQITSLDFSNNPLLEDVNCVSNQITSLNFSTNPILIYVICANNQLTSLDFSNNPQLTKLSCSYNNLSSLNIKNGATQSYVFGNDNDCWKQGNPNLTSICADAGEVASVQSFLDGCGDAGQVVMVTSTCSMANEGFTKDSFTISPNPTNGNININYNGNYNGNYNDNSNSNGTIKMVQLYDSQGRVLLTKTSAENPTTLDVSGYASGVYFVKIVGEAGEKIVKVVKE